MNSLLLVVSWLFFGGERFDKLLMESFLILFPMFCLNTLIVCVMIIPAMFLSCKLSIPNTLSIRKL